MTTPGNEEATTELPPATMLSASEEYILITKYQGREYGIKVSCWEVRSDRPWEWVVWPRYGFRGPHGEVVGSMDDALMAAREAIVQEYS